jgi:hypothetical protein
LKRRPQQQRRPLPTNLTKVALCEAHVQVGFFPNFSTFRASTFDHDLRIKEARRPWEMAADPKIMREAVGA